MKKFYLIAAAAAAVLAAGCAKNEVIQNQGPGDAVSFGVYAGKTATKAVSGTNPFGDINTAGLQGSSSGFGVFAYYTDNADYTSGSYYANFMYNEQVTYVSDQWEYTPVKYWPNEHGASASSGANVDKLTFLAYAPWVDIKDLNNDSPSTVKDKTGSAAATEGIISMTGNAVESDAKLSFVVPASTAEQIDLLYGVLRVKSVNVDGTEDGVVNGPIENLTKEKTGGKVDILFKHALAKVTLDIKDVIDAVPAETSVNPGTTKVFVKSLNILGSGLGTSGKLNLYTGLWTNTEGTGSFSVSPLPTSIYQASAPANGNAYDALSAVTGVIETGLGASKQSLMFVPAGTITGVEIVYYVCTRDANLATGVSVVENHITKTLASPITIQKGYQYNVTILLGLTSVKLTASVEDWNTDLNGNSTDDDDIDINLPQNVN